MLGAEVPWIEWPLSPSKVPDTPVILDLLEFCTSAVGEPIQGAYQPIPTFVDRAGPVPRFPWLRRGARP